MKRSPYVPLSTAVLFVALSSCTVYPAWATTVDNITTATSNTIDETIVTSTLVDNPLEIAYQETTVVEESGADENSWVGVTPEVELYPTSSPGPTDDVTPEPSVTPSPTVESSDEASPEPPTEQGESSAPTPEPTSSSEGTEPTLAPSVNEASPSPTPEPSVEPTTEPTTEPSPTSSPAELILPVPAPAETATNETKTSPVAPYTPPVVNLPTVAQNSPTIPRVATDGMGSTGPNINAAAPGPSVQQNQNNGNVGHATNDQLRDSVPVEQSVPQNSVHVSESPGTSAQTEAPKAEPSPSPSITKTSKPSASSTPKSQVTSQLQSSAPVLVLRYPAPRDYSQLSTGDVQSIFQQAPPVEKVIGPVENGYGLPITEAKNTTGITQSPAATLVSSESTVAPKEPVNPLIFVGVGLLGVVALGTAGLVITRRSSSS